MADTVRYGLISTARIGFSAHVPAANDSLHSEIVAVSSRNLETARAAARAFGLEPKALSLEFSSIAGGGPSGDAPATI